MSITRKQAEILSNQLFPHANYLIRLRERAQRILPVSDPLMQSITKAQEALQELCTKVQYLSCASGVAGLLWKANPFRRSRKDLRDTPSPSGIRRG